MKPYVILRLPHLQEDEGAAHFVGDFETWDDAQEWLRINADSPKASYFRRSDYGIFVEQKAVTNVKITPGGKYDGTFTPPTDPWPGTDGMT